MKEYVISNGNAEATVSSLGGTVINFKVRGEDIFSPWRMISDKQRGGCFMCVPWFGLSQRGPRKHGYLRDEEACGWLIRPDSVDLIFPPVAHKNYLWVLEYLTSARILNDGSLQMKLMITRAEDGVEGLAPVLPGFHPFLACKDANEVRISVGDEDFSGFPEESKSVPLSDGLIWVYTPEGNIHMEFKGDIPWSKKPQMVFWTDAPDKYVCVEPIIQDKKFFDYPGGCFLGEGEVMCLSILFHKD